MNKKEMAIELRKKISDVIKCLPDVEYSCISVVEDVTTINEFDREESYGGIVEHFNGTVHTIEIAIEEVRDAD